MPLDHTTTLKIHELVGPNLAHYAFLLHSTFEPTMVMESSSPGFETMSLMRHWPSPQQIPQRTRESRVIRISVFP